MMRGTKKQKDKKQKNKKAGGFFILLFFCAFLQICFVNREVNAQEVVSEENTGRENIRVGFFQWDGYHMEDEKGIKSGYGYDFLKMMQDYANWKYEYIGYDKSWADMLSMLEKGEIDLVTSAQKMPMWEAEFDYSDNPIGTSATVLTVKQNDERYTVGDTKTYDGMRVGVLKNSSRNKSFMRFADLNGFHYKPVYFDSQQELTSALQEGKEVDAILTSSLRSMEGEMVLEEFDPVDFYVIVKKGNTELLEKVNYAISQMDMNQPGWRLTLKNEYFSGKEDNGVSFNQEELSYIQKLKEENRVFTVVTNPDLAPYSYFEDGQAKGIAPEIFAEIADRVGISYEMVSFDTYEDYNQFVRDGKADIDLTCFASYGLAEDHGVVLSNAYISTSLAMLTKDTFDGNLKSLAQMQSVEHNTIYAQELLDTVQCRTYETHADCIQAVLDGSVDATYLYTYAAQKAVEEDVKNRLMYTILPEYEIEIAIGVNEDLDYRLLAILDEGIRSVSGSYVQKVIQNDLADIAEKDSVISLLYDYPALALVFMFVFLSVLFLGVLFLMKTLSRIKEHKQAQELSRFMGYVCEANELVLEVNMDNNMCHIHNMVDGKLISQKQPYQFAEYQNGQDVIHPDDFQALSAEFKKENFWENLSEEGKGTYFEARAKNEKGEYCWYSYTIRPIPKDKIHPNNFILFKKNIDSVKKREEEQTRALEDALETARNASTAKGQFLSKMSHEIRTPLNAVIGYMNMARDAEDNPSKIRHCIESCEVAAKHLLSIINDILDISSIESGKMKIAHEEFDLKKQLTTITTLFYNQAREKQVDFDVQIKDITEEWVIGDMLRLNQILMNLLSNSIKFTPEQGRIVLKVTQMRKDKKRVYMKFEISDTGIGMSEEYRQRLFEPFEQESATTAQKYGGTGLGLSITNNLIQMMGGSVEVESEVGVGSTFIVSLYFERAKNQHENQVQHDYSHVRALIVDDEESSLEYMKALLKRCKVKSDVAKNGEAALKQIRRRMGTEYGYNLCILDWKLPGDNGIELAGKIRELCGKEMPMMIATAYDVNALEEEAKAAGIQRVIAKPLFQSTMFDLLVSAFGKYEPEQKVEQEKIDLTGLKVLLAEDNPMNMEIAVDILSKNGIQVTSVENGVEAVELFTKESAKTFDVILMDIQMPVMDGYQATGAIRKSDHPEAKTIPIIAMTANAFAEDVTAALASGMNGHIAKPIDYEKLYEVLYLTTNRS